MLDSRMQTFLAVCRHLSYTRAARELYITQPAVTQHIRFLETHFGCRLFVYEHRKLRLTPEGELLYRYGRDARATGELVRQQMAALSGGKPELRLGATLTIGEFTLAPVLSPFMEAFSSHSITLYVDNTREMLSMLESGTIHFALVEGLFNREHYHSRLLKMAEFVLVVPSGHRLSSLPGVRLEDLREEQLIIREPGSGSREVLQQALYDRNLTLEFFPRRLEIGNVSLIKHLVRCGSGISFMYQDALAGPVTTPGLSIVPVEGFGILREFNFVHLDTAMATEFCDPFYHFFREALQP